MNGLSTGEVSRQKPWKVEPSRPTVQRTAWAAAGGRKRGRECCGGQGPTCTLSPSLPLSRLPFPDACWPLHLMANYIQKINPAKMECTPPPPSFLASQPLTHHAFYSWAQLWGTSFSPGSNCHLKGPKDSVVVFRTGLLGDGSVNSLSSGSTWAFTQV